jgi:hypothetical protein
MSVNYQLAMQLLTQAAQENPKGKAGVAASLGYGRSLISRVLSPNDKCEMSEDLAKKIIDRLYVIPECPATSHPQPRSECSRLNSLPAPMHNPLSMRIWRVCQTCEYKPEKGA